MYTYKLVIMYDGTQYSGWQIQPCANSIQEQIEKVLRRILQTPVFLIGSGRTDAGVHAKGQVAHFQTEKVIDLNRLQFACNRLLPLDIRIQTIEQVSPHFHARYSAIGKEYHYYIHVAKVMNPFYRFYRWHFCYPYDFQLIKQAAFVLLGTHDFTSFAHQATAGSAAHNAIRTLYRLDVFAIEDGIRLEFEGNGFLYKMVRNLVGMLMAIATNRYTLNDLVVILKAKDRRLAAQTAPPQGLFLMRVDYPSCVN